MSEKTREVLSQWAMPVLGGLVTIILSLAGVVFESRLTFIEHTIEQRDGAAEKRFEQYEALTERRFDEYKEFVTLQIDSARRPLDATLTNLGRQMQAHQHKGYAAQAVVDNLLERLRRVEAVQEDIHAGLRRQRLFPTPGAPVAPAP